MRARGQGSGSRVGGCGNGSTQELPSLPPSGQKTSIPGSLRSGAQEAGAIALGPGLPRRGGGCALEFGPGTGLGPGRGVQAGARG